MESLLRLIKKISPKFLLVSLSGPYHFVLAFLADLVFNRPSRKMFVIGVTGTKGKTTTCHLIAEILNRNGKKTGMTSSIEFWFGDEKRPNDLKQGMPGRFRLQKLLYEMNKKGCEYAVVETTSEGMLQYRHRFIDYKAVVFTNLSPEHIERHGGFKNYKETKVGLFKMVARKRGGVGVYNLDDGNVESFLEPKIRTKAGFSLEGRQDSRVQANLEAINVRLETNKSLFDVERVNFEIPLIGKFNVYNAMAAITTVGALGVSLEQSANALRKVAPVSGRFEIIQREPFTVVVDYAHEPKSLEECYRAAEIFKKDGGRIIGLLGAQGGGRDRWKRAEMGRIASKFCDVVMITNEDPYDEDPLNIIEGVRAGAGSGGGEVLTDENRDKAIGKVISFAKPGDVVVLTGKGGEVWMCVDGGRKIPWNESEIVRKFLRKADIA